MILLTSKVLRRCRSEGAYGGVACWVYFGSRTTAGYGTFTRKGVTVYCHREAYRLFRDDVPEGLSLDHLCRNRACCNPWHLEPVTHAENMRRAGINRKSTPLFPCGHDRSANTRANRNDCVQCHRDRERCRRRPA